LQLCPLIPPKIEKRIPVNTSKASITDIEHYLSYLLIKPKKTITPASNLIFSLKAIKNTQNCIPIFRFSIKLI
jgi:hypothetical protein